MPALYLPAPASPPDPDFRETVPGGHALILDYAPGHAVVVEYGACEFWFSCECGYKVPLPVRPDRPFVPAVERVLSHSAFLAPTVFSGHPLTPHCQCGAELGAEFPQGSLTAELGPVLDRWERHSMGAGQ